MTIRQLLSERSFVPDSLGNPARTAYMHIFEPGTTTRVTSYKDGALQNPNVNPVPMSASGKASVWVSRDIDVLITLGPDNLTDPVLVDERNANPDVAGGTSSGLVPNGSFENDTDANDVPDGWVEVAEIGSNNGIDTGVSSDGLQSFRFTSVGTGGGSLTTDDFFAVNDVDDLRVNFDIISSVVDVRNIVRVEWYDISQVPISNTDVYDNAVSNPLVFTPQALVATPPAGARFAKLRLIGCDPSDVTPGTTWYDRVNVFYPLVVAGVFDNITIQNNEIVSTNTDGRIQLRPNGNGGVDVTSDGTVDLAGIENPFNVGNVDDPSANPHIAFDATQVQAKADGTNAAPLGVNLLGGLVTLGSLQVNGILAELVNTAATATNLRARNSVGGISVALDSVGDGSIIQTDSAGVAEDVWISLARNGGVSLNFNNLVVLEAVDIGIDVRRTTGTTTAIQLLDAAGTLEGQVASSSTGVFLDSFINGDLVTLRGSAAAPGDTLLVRCDPNGVVELFNNGTAVLQSTASGVDVGPNSAIAGLISISGATSGNEGGQVNLLGSAGNLALALDNSLGNFRVLLNNNTEVAIQANLNGSVDLRHNNISMARTAVIANGGFEVNNTVTGAGFERVLTVSDIGGQGAVKAANQNVGSSIVLVDATNLSVPLQPSSQYIIEATLIFSGNGATANGFRWGLDFNGQIANLDTLLGGSFSWQNSNGAESIVDAAAGGISQIKTTFDAAGVRETVKISVGIITQSDYVADTNVDIQFAQGTSDGTNTTLEEGSSLKVTRVA